MRCDLEPLSRVISDNQTHPNAFTLISLSTCRVSERSISYLLTFTMTLSTPSFVFPPNFSSHSPYNSSSQWQYEHGTDRPRSDTGTGAFGNYVSPRVYGLDM